MLVKQNLFVVLMRCQPPLNFFIKGIFIYSYAIYKYSGDMMHDNSSLENIELNRDVKIKLKTISVQKSEHMRDLIVNKAHEIIDNGDDIPRTERYDDRASLIIEVKDDFKHEIKTFCNIKDVRIRDFWVECVNRVIGEYNNDTGNI